MANNLLDKSSIILTPTAYNNGEALCVKPSDGSGDFDFSRNSAATRVNAQGLVENVQILSSNLVQNGDFSEEGVEEVSNGSFSQEGVQLITNGDFATDTNWNKQTSNWTIANGYAICDGLQTTNSSLFQDLAVVNGNSYRIDFTITDSANDLNLILGATTIGQYGAGTHSIYVTKDANASARIFFQATASNAFQGSIESVSVREVGQDWVLTDGCSITEQGVRITSDGTIQDAIQSNVVTNGKTYKVQYEIIEAVSGSLKITGTFGGNLAINSTVGVHTFYATAADPNLNIRRDTSPTDITITNISVKEVGQNWTLGSNIAIGENKLIGTNANSSTYQNVGIQANKKYKIQFTILDYSNGNVRFIINGSPNVVSSDVSSNGEHTLYINSNSNSNGYLSIQVFNNFNGSVTNVSAIQITDDTNLPRINYEGFSYQDVLGSELVLNGTFDSNIDFWNKGGGNVNPLSWNNGKIKITNDVAQLNSARQTIVTEIGKTYKVSADVDSTNGITPRLASSNPTTAVIGTLGTIETLTYTFTATSTSSQIELFNWQNTINKYNLWDNVSVKEYLGQEVVPDSGCGSWLFEPQSTNVITQSETFSDASWVNNGVTITSNEITSPSGTLNADLLTGVSGGFGVVKFSTWTATNKVASCFAKKGSTNLFKIANVSGGIGGVTFNLENGTVTNEDSGFDGEIENYGNGWYRCTAIDTLGRTGTFSLGVTAASESVYIWGAMLEQNSFSTSYIPTEGSQVTRNQDLCTNGGSLASINSTEGTLYFEGAALRETNDNLQFLSLGSGSYTSNSVYLQLRAAPNQFAVWAYSNNLNQLADVFSVTDITEFNKIAISYKLNDFKVYVNGSIVYTNTTYNPPTANSLNVLQFTRDTSLPFFGKTKALAVWKEALSDAELTELTTI